MKRVLLDTNVVLDLVLEREPFVDDAQRIWNAADNDRFDAYLAAFSLPTIYYISAKQKDRAAARKAIEFCLDSFEIIPLFRENIIRAQALAGLDFEDDLQLACAEADFLQAIVTRNVRDFAQVRLEVLTPTQFLAELGVEHI